MMILNVLCALAIAGAALLAELGIRRAVAAVRRWKLPTWRPSLPRPKRPPSAGKQFMAYALLAGGTGATIAANYAHAADNIGAKLLSAVIPVLLFFAFHIAAADGRWHIRVGTAAVALVCFAISYDHISHLAKDYNEGDLSAVLYPLGIDGAMIIGTFVLSRTADSVRTEDKPVLSPVRKPVRPVPTPRIDGYIAPEPGDRIGDKPRTNGFVRPMPPVRPKPVPGDNKARSDAAREIADELGDSLNRAVLVERLKAQGFKIGSQAAADLTRELKAARLSR